MHDDLLAESERSKELEAAVHRARVELERSADEIELLSRELDSTKKIIADDKALHVGEVSSLNGTVLAANDRVDQMKAEVAEAKQNIDATKVWTYTHV